MKKYPKGSMGAADQKSENRLMLAFSVAVVIVFCLQYLNLGHTYLFQYHLRADFAAKVAGVVLYAASASWMWFARNLFPVSMSRISPAGLAFALLAAAIVVASGLNFDLHGIEP